MYKTGLFLIFLFLTIGSTRAFGQWSNGQNAVSVLGQTDFVTKTFGSGSNKFSQPVGVAVDPATGKVFVSDSNNKRVLRFTSMQAMTTGGAAEAVLGQPDFLTTSFGTTQFKMNTPGGVFVDGGGRLWVADSFNHRILRFDNASTLPSGSPADAVLGQTDFNSGASGLGQNRLNFPNQIWAESGGRLWVADYLNNRVLRFENAAAKPNGANADGVLGQPDFLSNAPATTQNGMRSVSGVLVDGGGRLWVAEFSNHRVLRFENAATKPNGAGADGVLGQPDFTSSAINTTQDGMFSPAALAVDNAKRLYVAETNNNRVIIFNNAALLPNGANASNVIGQPDFTTNAAATTQDKLFHPYFLYLDRANGNLYVPEFDNNRVTRFQSLAPTAAAVSIGGRVTLDSRLNTRAAVTLTDASGNVRTALISPFGFYKFEDVAVGQIVTVQISAKGATFPPRVVDVTEDVTNLDFTAP